MKITRSRTTENGAAVLELSVIQPFFENAKLQVSVRLIRSRKSTCVFELDVVDVIELHNHLSALIVEKLIKPADDNDVTPH